MKKLSILLSIISLASCTKDFDGRASENINLVQYSYLRFYSGSLAAVRNFITIDNQRLNGIPLIMGGVFPGASTITAFATISPGTRSVSIVDSAVAPLQNPLTFSQGFVAGQYYTIYSYDTSNAVKALVVNDIINIPTDSTCNLKFVNIIFSSQPVTPTINVDVWSRARQANIFTNVVPQAVSAVIPHKTAVNDTLDIRQAGTTNILASVNGFTFNQRRNYTLVFRGRYQATSGSMSRGANIIATY